MYRILFAFGTRPEAIKLAPVIKELQKHKKDFQVEVCITAQHRHMLDQVLETFRIKSDFDLNIMKQGQTLFDINVRILRGLEKLLQERKPDLILVQGDTTTAFVSALAAFYCKIKIGHIEAGLRTQDKFAPFPEEMNRRLISHLADYHFAPTKQSKLNLLKEGISGQNIVVTGNTVIDALYLALEMNPDVEIPVLKKIKPKQKIILVTAHRRESFGAPFFQICQALKTIVQRNPDVEIVYPVHPNPNIWVNAHQILGDEARIHLIAPMDYLPFCHLMKKSYIILTDSGGIQEEAPALGKPVLVLRNKTERPEAIEAGTAKLVGTDKQKIVRETERLLSSEQAYNKMAKVKNPFGDGKASQRIKVFLKKVATPN
ncbi:MAG: UDP-N-acetylglucosamine 2-epimerase (non-hydrolyzing) [candidate division WOR-3 bacterium]|nr:UDP-N-acetylglucosamine 2-epimerase (non-hydrolyzing) [candidate division WOR-3 bacterium]